MKVLIATVGSQGDVQPYVALGKALVAAGHAASVCAPLHFESLVRSHGLDYQPMDNGFIELMATLEARLAGEVGAAALTRVAQVALSHCRGDTPHTDVNARDSAAALP